MRNLLKVNTQNFETVGELIQLLRQFPDETLVAVQEAPGALQVHDGKGYLNLQIGMSPQEAYLAECDFCSQEYPDF